MKLSSFKLLFYFIFGQKKKGGSAMGVFSGCKLLNQMLHFHDIQLFSGFYRRGLAGCEWPPESVCRIPMTLVLIPPSVREGYFLLPE
jgi:hypothetical protein